MPESLLQTLTAEQRRIARREALRINHRLADTGLFDDESLAQLIDLHPRAATIIRTLRPGGSPREGWISGEAAGCSGAALITAARAGRLAIRLDGVMTLDPACRLVFDQLLAEFRETTGVMALSADASIVITSPRLSTPMTINPDETALWRVRGPAALYLYPAGPDAALPWTPSREDTVTPVMLQPGQGAFWPLHSPYRVVNGDDLGVCVSLRFATPQSRLAGLVRRVLGQPSPAAVAGTDATPRFDITARGLVWRQGLAPDWAAAAKPARKPARKRSAAVRTLKAA